MKQSIFLVDTLYGWYLRKYEEWISAFFAILLQQMKTNEGGDFWIYIDAYSTLMLAKEQESEKTSFGVVYFMVNRALDEEEYSGFLSML